MGTIVSVALALGSAAASAKAQGVAADAQEMQAEHEADILAVEAKNQRRATDENRRRQKEDKERYLAKVRLQQANSGAGQSGSNQLVFDDITSRLDERINDMTDQGLAETQRIENRRTNTLWQGNVMADATRLQAKGTMLRGVGNAFQAYSDGKKNNPDGGDPDGTGDWVGLPDGVAPKKKSFVSGIYNLFD